LPAGQQAGDLPFAGPQQQGVQFGQQSTGEQHTADQHTGDQHTGDQERTQRFTAAQYGQQPDRYAQSPSETGASSENEQPEAKRAETHRPEDTPQQHDASSPSHSTTDAEHEGESETSTTGEPAPTEVFRAPGDQR